MGADVMQERVWLQLVSHVFLLMVVPGGTTLTLQTALGHAATSAVGHRCHAAERLLRPMARVKLPALSAGNAPAVVLSGPTA